MPKLVPVILCGGDNLRLWPLTRRDRPVPFLKLSGDRTLLQKTAERARDFSGADGDIIVVTAGGLKAETARQLEEISPFLTRHLLAEPEGRNTAAAVAFAATYAQRAFGDQAFVCIMPSDHFIGNAEILAASLHKALAAARDGYLVTLGIPPTRPETGYGYIRKAAPLPEADVFAAGAFVEKPPLGLAYGFVRSGKFLWNSGMHISRVSALLDSYNRHAPVTLALVQRSLLEAGSDQRPSPLLYNLIKPESFEKAVMEKADKIAVVPCDPQWADAGNWESLWEISEKDDKGNAVRGRVVCEKTGNCIIMAQSSLITCVGLKDFIVVETPDSVLVARRKDQAQLGAWMQVLQEEAAEEPFMPAYSPLPSGLSGVTYQ